MTDVPDIPVIAAAAASYTSDYQSEDSSSPTIENNRRSSFLEQEEGVLRDVLEELDRERHKRAELEAQVRVLQEELHSQRRKNSKSTKTSVRDYTQIVTERDGYKEILDALTQDRPAFATAIQQENKVSTQPNNNNNTNATTLPIHIIRLLEVMPWDSRAQQYIFGLEQLYEWQIYGADKKWKGKDLRQFPTFFKTLPIVVPTPGKTVNEIPKSSLPFGGIAPPKQCVLTNVEVNTILNIDQGYPLPEDGGGWTWVGPWRVEKNTHTDEQGWMYSNDVQVLSDPKTYYNEFRLPQKGQPNIMKRRRKWTRLRVLIDYPYASNMTREYLKMVAEKATLEVNVDKLSGQLVETKMVLTTMEAENLAFQERTNARIKELERDLADKNKILGLVEHGAGLNLLGATDSSRSIGSVGSETSDGKKIDQMADIRSAVTQWVTERVEKVHQKQRHNSKGDDSLEALTEELNAVIDGSPGDTCMTASVDSAIKTTPKNSTIDPKQQLFESLRDKGTGLFEVLKQKGGQELDKIKHGGGGLPWHRKSLGTHSRDNSQDTTGTNMNGTSNGTVHGKVAKLETLESENTAESTSEETN
ncbi:hypothetical protein IV203_019519 [Nitzschia inconspicua]|uniref:Uncharacterized protein n=1 Tax=Nitzschia inconspicua TaxID=303405 RepID=A0A9K3Q790_9STRA|nr:hypothetical protein IV203_019519 [Nitzschia inconspicua]